MGQSTSFINNVVISQSWLNSVFYLQFPLRSPARSLWKGRGQQQGGSSASFLLQTPVLSSAFSWSLVGGIGAGENSVQPLGKEMA